MNFTKKNLNILPAKSNRFRLDKARILDFNPICLNNETVFTFSFESENKVILEPFWNFGISKSIFFKIVGTPPHGKHQQSSFMNVLNVLVYTFFNLRFLSLFFL